MNILILNGSPKGENSITLQTCLYIQKHYPSHQYRVLHVGRKIRQFEQDFTPAAEALDWAELVIFCYPVYTFLVPSQLHRFVELMKEHGPAQLRPGEGVPPACQLLRRGRYAHLPRPDLPDARDDAQQEASPTRRIRP